MAVLWAAIAGQNRIRRLSAAPQTEQYVPGCKFSDLFAAQTPGLVGQLVSQLSLGRSIALHYHGITD